MISYASSLDQDQCHPARRFNLAPIASGDGALFLLGEEDEKNRIGDACNDCHGRLAMGSAFAQDAAKATPKLTAAEKEQAKKIYFERCAGCHGVLRKGATGKNLEPHWSKKDKDGNVTEGGTLKLGQTRLEKIIGYGTDGGMLNFDDILTKNDIALMAKYIQNTPDVPPEYSLKDTMDSWKVHGPGRPASEEADEQAEPEEPLLGHPARHRRSGADRRRHQGNRQHRQDRLRGSYFPPVRFRPLCSRDRSRWPPDLIDLWMEKPSVVAEVKIGFDARSIDTSKFKGFEDKYAMAGSYWPPQYTIMDGETLKPLKIVSTRGMTVDGEYHPEPRVASIVASFTSRNGWSISRKPADPAGRLLRHRQPEGHHHRFRQVPA